MQRPPRRPRGARGGRAYDRREPVSLTEHAGRRTIEREEDQVQGQASDVSEAGPTDDLQAVWRRAQAELRDSVPESTYRLWFEPLDAASSRGSVVFLTGPGHVRRWVSRRYPELLRAAFARAGAEFSDVRFVAPDDTEPAGAASPDRAARVVLNPAYTFERFVIGPGNRLAHGAALAVAESPGQAYNPLFLHGPPGLGKTHLLGAIANYLHGRSPELAVHYTTAESFTNDFVACLQSSGIEGFKERYRRADVLLIDDVQFLEGKARTADEFFHTFNALYESGAQIVLTADRMPAEISRLEERLRQRFEWGLTVPLEPPDLSTRLIFLGNLIAERSATVGGDALRAIASRASANLRLLDGALTRVIAVSSLTAEPVTPEVVDRTLPSTLAEPPTPEQDVAAIQDAVASRLEVSRDALLSSSRSAPIARARQLAMYLTRELTDLSLPAIAVAFNRRDHTTVMHAIKRVDKRAKDDPAFLEALEQLRTSLHPEPHQDPHPNPEMDRDRTD